jgi:hypothetical protein
LVRNAPSELFAVVITVPLADPLADDPAALAGVPVDAGVLLLLLLALLLHAAAASSATASGTPSLAGPGTRASNELPTIIVSFFRAATATAAAPMFGCHVRTKYDRG